MTTEELLALGLTQEQANQVFAMRGSEVNTLRSQITALTESNQTQEAELNTLRQQNMTTEQLQQQAVENANAEKAKWQKANNQLLATQIFAKAGMEEADYSTFIEDIVSDNEDKTKSLAEALANSFKTKLDAKDAELRDLLLKNPTPPEGGGGTTVDTLSEQEKIATQLAEESSKSTGFSAYLKGEQN